MIRFGVSSCKRAFSTTIILRNEKFNSIPIKRTRDIGIIAHIDAGKTTTTERILFFSGKTKRIGNVDQGDTVTDYLESERQRGITIQSAAITIPWNNNKINIIDTPGHADFTFEVVRSLRVLDGAVTILDAVEGVEAQTEKVWKQAQELELPKIAFINKMDREGAGFSRTVKEVVEKLQTRVVLCTLPYFEDRKDNVPEFKGVVDVINQKLLVWDLENDPNGRKISVLDASERPQILESIHKARESMIETLGEFDDAIIDAFLEHDENCMAISGSLINEAIRAACISNDVTPVFCGSAFKNIGVQPLMDGITNYLPSPLQIQLPQLTSHRRATKTKKSNKQKKDFQENVEVPVKMDSNLGIVINNNPSLTVALAFKVITDKIRGVMIFFRVYSGKLTTNTTFINTRTGKKHTVRNLLLMHGDEPEPVQAISSGNIGVIAGNEEIITGDTLVSHGSATTKSFSDLEMNLKLMPIDIPPPLFNSSIEPLTAGDERYMNQCIQSLLREDPSLTVFQDEELGQTIISGMGELHLEIVRERLVNDMKAKVKLRDVAVSYKETITKPNYQVIKVEDDESKVNIEITLDTFEGESSESVFAEEEGAELLDQDNNIVIFEPLATPEYMFSAIDERRWKSEYSLENLQDAIVQGLQIGLQIGGPILGFSLHSTVIRIKRWDFPVDDKSVNISRLLDITRRAVMKSIAELDPQAFTLLEPLMETKVYITSDKLGDVTHDLTQRCQANILSIEDEGTDNVEKINWAIQEAQKIYLPEDYTMKKSSESADIKNKKIVVAETPLREMVGYLSKLRSITKGRSTFDMTYLGMRRVVKARLNGIIKEFS
ncbi:Ribosome-releasing factor 2, mitochondrial [Yamadazyma tenuis]|uniref:Ribosome-releasing factor 2, mitochondrial n=1 Tax=Candida tenuis (strain ATCC 10573 / BCRC 21748 / CBS 615 / JCM 9827 / NBRC 10315 / NRRL Y-1498 / VKM Y-70) TaxID=590646 RepID=G3B222_CANTC|nr:uncharacterized protein CANTEDRAFT_120261 [Yamadazyma tenuis ATCC 10573]EGV64588.1 hypothetical protein CANTEDRAFT_120261 [Yamadazyma tenuis ATCC 10573]WEJ97354.1 Ribosome-releasing factor 2, mitochondrial [Yamadazyma tenuis]